MEEVDLNHWVEKAAGEKDQKIAVHILLHAIGSSNDLRSTMIMKGGNLLGIRHASSRYTKDVDFSTALTLKDIDLDAFKNELNDSLTSASSELGYTLRCWVQGTEVQPREDATFPSLQIKIGYADSARDKERKFIDRGISPKVLKVDYSFNEATYNSEVIKIADDASIIAYSIIDLMAEKIRSVLQQAERKRNREQDIYDLHYMLSGHKFDDHQKYEILDSLMKKSAGKGIDKYLTKEGFQDPEIRSRSSEEYDGLQKTVQQLPDFDKAYDFVRGFYESLPWEML